VRSKKLYNFVYHWVFIILIKHA